jgi:uncharacterized membrane protein YfcA
LEILIVGTVAVFFGGFLQGCLGFGFGMITVPLLLMVLAASEVVPMQIALSLMLSVPLAWQARHHLSAALVLPLLLGAIIGLPVGFKALTLYDGPYLKLTIGVILVVMSVAMLSGWSRPVKSPLLPLFPIGFLSGILQTTSAMSGPPIILFLTNQGMDKDRFRANILVYFALLGTISTVGYAWQGEFTQPVMQRMAFLSVSMIIGGFLGARFADRIPQDVFRKITLIVAAGMGLMLCVRNIAILLG